MSHDQHTAAQLGALERGRELQTNRIFLYDWLPIVHRRNLYERLSEARVEVMAYATDDQMQGLASG